MARNQKATNPFYVALLLLGVAFSLTACLYFVATLQGRELERSDRTAGKPSALLDVVDRYGFAALMTELGLLALATCAAIGTDEYWMRRAKSARGDSLDANDHRDDAP